MKLKKYYFYLIIILIVIFTIYKLNQLNRIGYTEEFNYYFDEDNINEFNVVYNFFNSGNNKLLYFKSLDEFKS